TGWQHRHAVFLLFDFLGNADDHKLKAPNPKLQHPEKFQTPNIKLRACVKLELGRLKFLWSLDVGAWSFIFGSTSSPSPRVCRTRSRTVRGVLPSCPRFCCG